MKLYATTTSERASKGQGGNDYLETVYNITDTKQPQARTRVIVDNLLGLVYFSVEEYHFNKWRIVYEQKYFIESKAEKKKAE